VIAVENGNLPLFDLRLAAEDLRYPLTYRPQLILACQHGFPGLPSARRDAAAGLPINQHGQTDAPVNAQQRGHHLIADVDHTRAD
jgi:hypothetical protein